VRSGRAKGVVLIGQWHQHERLNAMADSGLPLIVWGAAMGPSQRYASVGGDNAMGGRLATQHLLQQGRSRIVFMGDPELPEVEQRLRGHREALAEAGLQAAPRHLLSVPFDTVVAAQQLGALLDEGVPIDAIQACSDLLALTAVQVLRARGLRVPHDVAVVGFDDMPIASMSNPPVSSVHQPVPEAGKALVDGLLALLDGHPPAAHTLPVHMVARRSSQLADA
jgi:DNA-binding LacI/PurR family transcriptional regulator